MPAFDVEVTFEVFCGRCGEGLCNNSDVGRTSRRGEPFVKVEPCEKCCEKEYDKGYDKGYTAAQQEANV